jgi:hypothetical protein
MTKGNTICPRPFHGGGIKIFENASIRRWCQAYICLKNNWISFNYRFSSLITLRIKGRSRNMHYLLSEIKATGNVFSYIFIIFHKLCTS